MSDTTKILAAVGLLIALIGWLIERWEKRTPPLDEPERPLGDPEPSVPPPGRWHP